MRTTKRLPVSRVLGTALLLGLCVSFTTLPTLAAPAPESFADTVEPLMPAVVNISTTQNIKGRPAIPFMMPDMGGVNPFEEFFGKMQPGQSDGDDDVMPSRPVNSLGSGFVVDPTGYIVTNNHVIADAEEIMVTFQDNSERKARIVGRDPKTDLALLKVETDKPLPFVKFGDSDKTRVGDWVIAVGNPFGLGGTVTAGIISARARDINAGPFDNFLQTDAAINSGNSGGPMFNIKGEVIGINTAIFSPSGGNVGIGFATPATMAQPVIDQLKKVGRVKWGWLGVKIQSVTEEIANSLGLDKSQGALVVEITPGSPAEKTKLLPGDVIISFDGQPVSDMRSFPRIVAQTPVGKQVPLTVWRGSEKKNLTATIGESKEPAVETEEGEEEGSAPAQSSGDKLLGMEIAPPDATQRATLKLPKDVTGLLVLRLDRSSPAYARGIRPDDVLTRLNEQDIKTAEDVKKALASARAQGRKFALLRVWRGGETHFVTLPTAEK